MDYKRALNELYQERQQLGEVIKNLESLQQGKQPQPLRPDVAARACLPRNVK